jgi:hypothetical protein
MSNSNANKADCLSYVKRFISKAPFHYIFTTRELLQLAEKRAQLDYFLHRAARDGYLERLAWGVYRKLDARNKQVKPEQIAAIKRKAFAGSMTAIKAEHLELVTDIMVEEHRKPSVKERHFAGLGSSSDFLFTQCVMNKSERTYQTQQVRLLMKKKGTRKFALGESRLAKEFRRIWLKGQKQFSSHDIDLILRDSTKQERLLLPALKKYLPQWISDCIPLGPDEALFVIVDSIKIRKEGRKSDFRKPGKRTIL